MPKPRDPYLVLGVRRGADGGQVKRAYRRLVLELHPDVTHDPATTEQLREVQRAYESLEEEDASGSDEASQADGGQSPTPPAARSDLRHAKVFIRPDPEPLTYSDWRRSVRFNPDPFATSAARAFDETFRQMFSSLDELLGGFVPEILPRKPPAPKDLVVEITLSPEEALTGSTMSLTIPLQRRCPLCLGAGLGASLSSRCERCDGRGFIVDSKQLDLVVPPSTRDGDEASVPISIGEGKSCYLRVFVRVA
jgi:molecular chaperone DnaJ